jgi:hypothetical protein
MIKVKQVRHKSVAICRWSITHSVGFWDTHPTKSGVNWIAATLDYQSRVYTWTCLKMANIPRWQLIILIRSSRNLGPMHWAANQNQWLDLPLHPRKTGRPTASEAEPRHNIAANNCPLQKNKHLKSSFKCRMKSIPHLKPPMVYWSYTNAIFSLSKLSSAHSWWWWSGSLACNDSSASARLPAPPTYQTFLWSMSFTPC